MAPRFVARTRAQRLVWLAFGAIMAGRPEAYAGFPTELEDCTGSDANFCFDGAPALIDSGCGARFEGYFGRIAWPVMRNVGPVTISVQTLYSFEAQTFFPLYVEIVGRTTSGDALDCQTGLGGTLALVAYGAERCGGTWESVGQIDLVRYGVPLGDLYSVQCRFFRTSPIRRSARTVGFSCIRITSSPTGVANFGWGTVKSLYR